MHFIKEVNSMSSTARATWTELSIQFQRIVLVFHLKAGLRSNRLDGSGYALESGEEKSCQDIANSPKIS